MLPKWARCELAVDKLLNQMWGTFTKLDRDQQDHIKRALYSAWRKGYEARRRSAGTGGSK